MVPVMRASMVKYISVPGTMVIMPGMMKTVDASFSVLDAMPLNRPTMQAPKKEAKMIRSFPSLTRRWIDHPPKLMMTAEGYVWQEDGIKSKPHGKSDSQKNLNP